MAGSTTYAGQPEPAPFWGNWLPLGVHLTGYEGLCMSGNQDDKREAEQQVSKELANQPKRNGPEKEESKDRRADAEEKLTK